jgi:hypothetical protein
MTNVKYTYESSNSNSNNDNNLQHSIYGNTLSQKLFVTFIMSCLFYGAFWVLIFILYFVLKIFGLV